MNTGKNSQWAETMAKTANVQKTMYPLAEEKRTFLIASARSVTHPPPVLTTEERSRLRDERKKKVEAWKNLPLRQTWADEEHMRGFMVRYGVRVASDFEPATTARLRTILRRAGLGYSDWEDAVGCNLDLFLALNPNLPLWAAVAIVLESAS